MVEKDETTSSNGEDEEEVEEEWGTLEELLLACAVNRHGTTSWDAIAMELQNKLSFSFSFSPLNCHRKYLALKRRYGDERETLGGDEVAEEWRSIVDELRKLRVEELKREVQKRDVSIVSLEKKVKRLEDERETTSTSNKPEVVKPEPSDLKNELAGNLAGKHAGNGEKSPEKLVAGGGDGDSVEDRSCNESNTKADPSKNRTSRPGESRRHNNNDNININSNNNKDNNKDSNSDVQSSASLLVASSKRKKKQRRMSGSSGDDDNEAEVGAEELSPANRKMSVKSQPLIRFLDVLQSHKHGSVFHRRLPSQETEKYRNIVRQHMDLDTVQSKLDKGIYGDCHHKFYRDLLLIFTNAVLFYRKSSAEHIAARELRKLVIDEIAIRTRKPNIKIQPVKPELEPQHLEPVVKKPRSSTTMVVCRRRSSMQPLSESMRKKDDFNQASTINNGSKNSTVNSSSNRVENGREEKAKANHLPKKVDGSNGSNGTLASRKERDQNEKKTLTKERSSLGRGGLRLSNNNSKKIISKDAGNREKVGGKSSTKNNGHNSKEDSSEGEGAEAVEIRKKMNADHKGTTALKKQGVANFLKRMKQNSPSSQEKSKKNDSEGEEDEDGGEERGRRDKAESNSNKKKGGNVKKSNGDIEAVATRRNSGRRDERELAASKRVTGRPPKRKAAMMSGGNTTPESGKGGRSGGRDGGGEKSKKKPRR